MLWFIKTMTYRDVFPLLRKPRASLLSEGRLTFLLEIVDVCRIDGLRNRT
jgi:hypothetical protein